MPQINDAILAATGGPTVNDGLLAYYQLNSATSNDLQDAEHEFLLANGSLVSGNLNDLWNALLGGLGYVGAIDDRRLTFWDGGGSLIPLLTFGPELITNGDFVDGSNWTNLQNVTIAAGVADFTSTPNDMRQEGISLVNGNIYRFTITISSGVFAGLGMGLQLGSNNTVGRINANGVLLLDITADGTNDRLRFRSTGGNTFTGNIDNISLREIL